MLVRTYATKNDLSIDDVLDALTQCGNQDWKITTKLTASQIRFLNQTFTVGESESHIQLPPPKEILQLSESKENSVTSSSTQLTTTEKKELVQKFQESKDLIATEEIQSLRTDVKTTVIKESAQIAAITDYQTYQDTYEETTRDLVLNEVFSHLETQTKVREEFKSEQLLRQQSQAKPQSKDLTSELLELWGNDSNDFVNDLLKNIK